MAHDTFDQIRTDILDRAQESPIDASNAFWTTCANQIVRAYHEICNQHPFLFLRASPPGAIRTIAPITTGTVQVTLGSATITFSSAPAATVAGYKFKVDGVNEWYRIASHTAAAAAATIDVTYTGDTNLLATYSLFQDEYSLDTTCRHLVAMFVAEDGSHIDQMSEEKLRENYSIPTLGWPPAYFARIGETKIRFSTYPDRARRIEYAYTAIQPDIDGASAVIYIPRNFRYVIADGGLYWLYIVKNDNRADAAGLLYKAGIDKLIEDDLRKRVSGKQQAGRGPY